MADNVAGLLCYSPVGLIADIIFLVTEPYKSSRFIRFHCFQSLFLAAAMFVFFIGLSIVGGILTSILGLFALLMFPVWLVLILGSLGLWVWLMIQAYQMKRPKLPVIGDLAAKNAGM